MSEYIPERALFIAAHPDDLEFGVAGTAAKWANYGCEVTFCLITDGNAGTHEAGITAEQLADIRRQEQREAAGILGVKTVEFLGYDDCKLENSLELREKLVRLIRKYRPNVLGCQDPTNVFPRADYINHPDHRAAGNAVIDAAFPSSEMPLLYPNIDAEGFPPHKANYVYIFFTTDDKVNQYVDITETLDKKARWGSGTQNPAFASGRPVPVSRSVSARPNASFGSHSKSRTKLRLGSAKRRVSRGTSDVSTTATKITAHSTRADAGECRGALLRPLRLPDDGRWP